MKIRPTDRGCEILGTGDERILWSYDERGTYWAIKRLRQFCDAWAKELKTREGQPPISGQQTTLA